MTRAPQPVPNCDEPIEYLTPPFYLGRHPHRNNPARSAWSRASPSPSEAGEQSARREVFVIVVVLGDA